MTDTSSKIKHFLDISDIELGDLQTILKFAKKIKADEKSGTISTQQALLGKQVALVFEKPSTRTRVSFESGVNKLGGNAIVLDSQNTQIDRGEPVSDTAKVLSSYVDIIMLRCFQHETLLEMSRNSSIPVINGLTDYSHPCQVMADILTFEETKGSIEGKKIAWIGDCNNMANSWIQAAEKFGFELNIACPEELSPPDTLHEGVKIYRDPKEAVANADLVNTDTWVSMGDEGAESKKEMLDGYQVDEALMELASPHAIFMHCLPAHRGEEVSASVIDGSQSVVWQEAGNRLYVQQSILLWCLNKIKGGKIVRDEPYKGAQVLIVEDNQSEAKVIRKVLEGLGCVVTIAHDGEDAVNKIKTNEFDIIFMDCLMPVMNGFDATQIIRKDLNKTTPIIAITSEGAEVDQKRGAQVGMNGFITKPVGPKRISDMMGKWYQKN